MTVRTTYTATALEVLTAANVNKLPAGWGGQHIINSGTITAGVAGTNTDITNMTLTVTVPASRLVEVRCFIPRIGSNTTDVCGELMLYEGATKLGGARFDTGPQAASANGGVSAFVSVLLVAPSAGSHTYKAVGVRSVGTGLIDWYSASDLPAYMAVIDLGPST